MIIFGPKHGSAVAASTMCEQIQQALVRCLPCRPPGKIRVYRVSKNQEERNIRLSESSILQS